MHFQVVCALLKYNLRMYEKRLLSGSISQFQGRYQVFVCSVALNRTLRLTFLELRKRTHNSSATAGDPAPCNLGDRHQRIYHVCFDDSRCGTSVLRACSAQFHRLHPLQSVPSDDSAVSRRRTAHTLRIRCACVGIDRALKDICGEWRFAAGIGT